MHPVFVSYSRANLEVVTQLVEDIEAVGIGAWHDQTLTGGQRWWDNILANIRACEVFVAALSPDSLDSEACRSELAYARELGKTILPVLVADGVNPLILPHPLNEIQISDYRRRDKAAAFALIKCINVAPPSPALPDPLPAPPPVPKSYLSDFTERIDSAQPMTAQDQMTLVFQLETALREGRSSANEIRDLLLKLKRREDLLAKVAVRIDAALEAAEGKSMVASAATPASSVNSTRDVSAPPPPPPPALSKFCRQCGTEANPGARFCFGCGASLADQPQQQTSVPQASKSRTFVCPAGDIAPVISDLRGWLDSQGFDTQQMSTETGGTLLQVKKRGAWRGFVGMSTSLNVVFHSKGDNLAVEIGAGKWLDKAAAGAVSLIVLWPLAVTASFGAWEQSHLPERIFERIGARLSYR